MDDFINVTRRDPQVQIKLENILDNFIKLSLNYQTKIGYDTLSQNVTLKEIIKLMGIITVDIDTEL